MWRAQVIERTGPGEVVVTIPDLFRDSPVGPMLSAVDAQVGDHVIVADLARDAKIRDWWVMGFASTIGRWGTAYPHEHPLGQVVGLVDALAGKAPTTHTHAQTDVTGLTTALSQKANSTHTHAQTDITGLSTALAGKVNAPGPWVTCTPSTYITKLEGGDIQVRTTPDGLQLRSGRWRYIADVPRDSVIFTLPAGHIPPYQVLFMTSGMSNSAADYGAVTVHLETRAAGTVTARSAHVTSPTITLSHTLMF